MGVLVRDINLIITSMKHETTMKSWQSKSIHYHYYVIKCSERMCNQYSPGGTTYKPPIFLRNGVEVASHKTMCKSLCMYIVKEW